MFIQHWEIIIKTVFPSKTLSSQPFFQHIWQCSHRDNRRFSVFVKLGPKSSSVQKIERITLLINLKNHLRAGDHDDSGLIQEWHNVQKGTRIETVLKSRHSDGSCHHQSILGGKSPQLRDTLKPNCPTDALIVLACRLKIAQTLHKRWGGTIGGCFCALSQKWFWPDHEGDEDPAQYPKS